MNKYNFELTFPKNNTNNATQIDHIWTNVPTQQCHFGSIETIG
jgi:hypothetical protein